MLSRLFRKFFLYGFPKLTAKLLFFFSIKVCKQLPQSDQQKNTPKDPGPFFDPSVFFFIHDIGQLSDSRFRRSSWKNGCDSLIVVGLIVGAAFSRDHAMIAVKRLFFRGWKPLPRGIDVKLMT
jgi:hypothetical protein